MDQDQDQDLDLEDYFGQGQVVPVSDMSVLTCNHRFKGGDCPRCGSKMKRADF